MALLKCKMCGGDVELVPDKTFGTCEYCGNTMTFPKVDDDQRATAFNRGNHFRRIGEFDKALAVYERIVREDENDAEAHWCCALCRFGIEYVEDPATYEWLPTCHRASFDSFLEDVDYLAAVEHSDGITRRQYQKDAAKIAEVQRGILATSQNAEPYDVFICYKESDAEGNRTRDSLMAQDIYYQLTEQGRRVFFARITLEDVAGAQYEPYIFAALNSAKVMIVVGTKPEHLNAVWVKNEWSRFLTMMKKDRHKLLLPCYRDMDPYDMPEALSVLQSYDMGKIGFIQDLTRGIAKVLDAEKKPEPAKETVVVQQMANSNAAALLKRGNMALEDGEWGKADQFFEDVLNQDPECAHAYLGKFLAKVQTENVQQAFAKLRAEIEDAVTVANISVQAHEASKQEWIDQVCAEYVVSGILNAGTAERLFPSSAIEFESSYAYWAEQAVRADSLEKEYPNLQRAIKMAGPAMRAELEAYIEDLKTAIYEKKHQAEAHDAEVETRSKEESWKLANQELAATVEKQKKYLEDEYQKLCRELDSTTDYWRLKSLANNFFTLGNYRDSFAKADEIREKLKELDREKEQRQKMVQRTASWMSAGRCQYCGGEFKGVFGKKCAACGKPKDY